MTSTRPISLFSGLLLILLGGASAPMASLAADAALDRSVLPIPEPTPPKLTELDARNAKAPPRFQVTAPAGAPNVLIVLGWRQ